MYDLLLRNVRPMAGEACDILIKGGKIAGCGSFAPEAGTAVEDGQGAIVVPGLIDAHTHLDKTTWGMPWHVNNRAAILRERVPDLKLRFVNVVDLFRLQPASEHPHGSSERDFDSLFTTDKPIIFNFHGYPWLIHKLSYRFRGHDNLHVRGYKEKGNINTPLELAMLNETSRFHLVIDVINRVPKLRNRAAHLKEEMKNAILENTTYAHENGADRPEIVHWTWPF